MPAVSVLFRFELCDTVGRVAVDSLIKGDVEVKSSTVKTQKKKKQRNK